MVDEVASPRPADPRVSTGNPSLDAMLEGGLVARRPYLIVGPSGTGKTSLALQFLCDGVRRGERVLLVTLEEPPNEARVNHRGMVPTLDRVEVFDAIPDIMRYERTPFKDISSVRSAVPFAEVPFRIRTSPELASVEVTITALEQMLRTEVSRKNYTRLVIDSLTALQYFCMKGFDPIAGAQSLLRFLSDLRVTTILTVEAPLEDVETPERMLARGEIRLFRWELDGQTVRAVGVEKFRGSSHDVRLHPYRIGPQGIDINLDVTISRDTRQIIEPILPHPVAPAAVSPTPAFVSSVTPLIDEVRDLILLGAEVVPVRSEIEAALAATTAGEMGEAQAHLSRVSSLVMGMVDRLSEHSGDSAGTDARAAEALQRVVARADTVRTGVPPTSLPAQSVLEVQLGALLSLLPAATSPVPSPSVVAASPPVTPAEPESLASAASLAGPPVAEVTPPEAPELEAPAPGSPAPEMPPIEIPAPVMTPPDSPVGASPPSESEEPKPARSVAESIEMSVPADSPPTAVAAAPETPVPAVDAPEPELIDLAAGEAPTAAAVAHPPELVPPARTPPAVEPLPSREERPIDLSPPPRKVSRPLPAPPKPRSPITDLRVERPAAPAPPRRVDSREAPPPLPNAPMPDWLAPPPDSEERSASRSSTHVAPPAREHPGSGTPLASPAKRRRKAAMGAAGRKSVSGPKSPADHAPSHPLTSVAHGGGEPPAPPSATASAPAVSASGPPGKARRKTPRKRKAPPVVAVEVAPSPPEEPSGSTPPSSPPAPVEPPLPREG